MTKVIVTGGCGFIGSHLVEHLYKNTDWNICILDKLNYASKGYSRIRDYLGDKRVKVFCVDLCNPISDGLQYELGNVDHIIHLAAETHVDNSIKTPVPFIQNNVMSTVHLLEYARTQKKLKAFFYFSTDEVFGSAPSGVSYKEWDRHKPTNPYSASKSAAENICLSYENTYKVPIMIVNVMNAFGERQHVEKFIPMTIKKILNNEMNLIHSYPDKKRSGTRYYIHARNIASAILFLLKKGKIGEKYNVVGEKEVSNLEMAKFIAKVLNKKLNYKMVDFHSNRPGHDLHYRLDGTKMKNLGWKLPISFEESLKKTILWTIKHQEWLKD